MNQKRVESLATLLIPNIRSVTLHATQFHKTKHKGRLAKRMNFRRTSNGGGSFLIPKFVLQILGALNRAFEHEIDTKEQFQGSGYVF